MNKSLNCLMLILASMLPIQALAFSCARPSPQQTLQSFDAVVIGKITNSKKMFGSEVSAPDGYISANLDVLVINSYKGLGPNQTINVDVKYNPLSMDKEPIFNPGEEFFFPLSQDKASDRYLLNTTCSNYFRLDAKSKFLTELKNKGS